MQSQTVKVFSQKYMATLKLSREKVGVDNVIRFEFAYPSLQIQIKCIFLMYRLEEAAIQ